MQTSGVKPETQYVVTPDGAYIAYQVVGDGPIDLVWQFDFVGNVDLAWEAPDYALWFTEMASFARLILHDRRGTGLSSRNVPPPDLETRVADFRLILDAVGAGRPVLAGAFEGGSPNMLLAASNPERVHSVVWWSPSPRILWSPDYPWGVETEFVETSERELQHWGTLEGARAWAQAEAIYGREPSEEEIYWHAKLDRLRGGPDLPSGAGRDAAGYGAEVAP